MTKQEDFCKSAKEKSKIKLKLVEINPYIRFAAKIKLYSSENITTSYDCRFLYITKGICILTINNREYALKSDDAALWNSGQKYSFAASDDCECYIINFDYTQDAADKDNSFLPVEAKDFDRNKLVDTPYFSDGAVLNEPIIRRFADSMRIKASNLCSEFNQKKIYYSELCGIKMKEIIFEMLREIVFVSKNTSEMLDTILAYIKEHYRENITNEQLGKLVGYHSYYINKLMLDYVGTTLHQYLLNYRMENALKLLLDPDKSIADVALESGFRSFYYFSRYFKERMGLSPAQYRKARRSMI